MQGNTVSEVLPRHVVAGTAEQDVLDSVQVERGRRPAGGERAGRVRDLPEGGVPAELSVGAVGSDASADAHHWVALCTQVQGEARGGLDGEKRGRAHLHTPESGRCAPLSMGVGHDKAVDLADGERRGQRECGDSSSGVLGGEVHSRQRMEGGKGREVGEDVVDKMRDGGGLGEAGDRDASLGVASAVKHSSSRTVLHESTGGGVARLLLEQVLCPEEETGRGLCAHRLERGAVGLCQQAEVVG